MGRHILRAVFVTALFVGGWRLLQEPAAIRDHAATPVARVASAPQPLPEAAEASLAESASFGSPGLEGRLTRRGVRWSAPDGRWQVSWGWSSIGGVAPVEAAVRVEEDRWIADHGAIREVFERRANGVEHIITVIERPSRLEVHIDVDADARSWDFDGQPRVTLSRPGEGDLLEVQGLHVYDAENRELRATLACSPRAIRISVEDDGATYPVTIDPLITPPSWSADPVDSSWNEFGTSVDGAGDFNRDGFADIVVGTTRGSYERVFLYLGSAQGPAATATWTLTRPMDGSEGFGSRVVGAGDVNGDGFSDIAVGSGNGRVALYLGGTSGPTSQEAWTATPASTPYGETLAAAGDVNRDGRADLLVGVQADSLDRGAVYLYFGTASGLASSPGWSVSAAEYSTRFGSSVASAGDVNGDGYVDVVIGAPAYNGQAAREGRAYLYLGTATGLSSTATWSVDPTDTADSQFGTSVAGAGDINQDGYADVLVGSRYNGAFVGSGRVYLYLGSANGLSTTPAWVVSAPDADAGHFGFGVCSPGDLNGDGRRDVAISAPWATVQRSTGEYAWPQSGAVFVYLNSATGLSTVPSIVLSPTGQANSYFGRALSSAGDTNGDGRPDLLVGAPKYSRDSSYEKGRAYVYFGTATRTAVPWLLSPSVEARLGTGTPTLDWNDVADANGIQSYDVEVDDAPTFAAPLLWSETVTASQATTGMLPEGAFYWRVRARDGLGNLSDWSVVRKAYADGVGPLTPQPFSPVGDAWTTATPRLSWTGSGDFSGVANYDVQVAREADFSGPIEFSATTQYAIDTTTLGEGRHYWRVRARDPWGWTSAWAVASFVVDAVAPSAPMLVSPADGAALNVATPVLDWSDSTDTNGVRDYLVYVDTEPNFASPIPWAASVPVSRAEVGSIGGTQFYWMVGARDLAGNISWSAVRRYTRASGLPGAVWTVSPANATGTGNPLVSLDWTDATDPDGIQGYEAQVSTDRSFVTITWMGTTSSSSATTASLPEAMYYWRVRARDAMGNLGDWSNVPTFYVDATPPTACSQVSPANGAAVFSSSPVLDWTDSTDSLGYVRYQIQYDTEPTFTDPVTLSPTGSASVAYLNGFSDGVYYWRVRALDAAANASAFSTTWSFTVDATPPVAPTLLSPAAGAIVLTATPLLDWTDVAEPGVTYEVAVDDESTFSPPVLGTASGLTASQWTPPWLGDNATRYWRVRTVDARGSAGAWSGTSSFVVDRNRGFYVGLGAGAAGQIAACRDDAAGFGWRLTTLADTAYNAASGETRVAAGDLDGDGTCELVVGRARYNSNGGWFAIVDDQGASFTVLRWMQVPFSAYNATNGETWPACGDIDGDGRDEIVIGLGTYTAQGGYFALYNDASSGYAFMGWRRVSWSQYNAANGETRPACGDVTGDGRAEVFIGLGRYPARGGRVARYASGSVAFSAWMQFSYSAYNAANGETWPACGDVDGDGRDELCVGMGAYPQGGGYFQYFDDSVARYASLGLKRLPWTEYNNAVGETRPSCGPLVGGAGDETVIGLGAWAPAAGYVAIVGRSTGYALSSWRRVPLQFSTAASGATRPSVRR